MAEGPVLGLPRPLLNNSMTIKAYPIQGAEWDVEPQVLENRLRDNAFLNSPVQVNVEYIHDDGEAMIKLNGAVSLEALNNSLSVMHDSIAGGHMDGQRTTLTS